ncbi:hypothetical protein TNCV_1427581 [Trichonephila clavipes]|nr:hypothetical protein TNCV_1427581 [Trichonephila clavipes]
MNRWVKDSNTERIAGSLSQWLPITSSVALMDLAATSRALSQVLMSLARQQYQDGRIPVWQHHGESPLAVSIRHHLTGPSPALLPIANRNCLVHVCEASYKQARNHASVTTVDELWHGFEAAWPYVPVHPIQSRFYSMPRHINAVITTNGVCFMY